MKGLSKGRYDETFTGEDALPLQRGFVVLTVYDRHRCQTIARYTGKFSPHLKVKLEFTLVLLSPELPLSC